MLDDSDYLARQSLGVLESMREGAPKAEQDRLAPFAHRAYARQVVRENPAQALGLAAAIPAYTASKALGITKTRSGASVEEMTQGYAGVLEGLAQRALLGKEDLGLNRPTKRMGVDGSMPTRPAQRRIRHGGGGVRG
jgi:hypothetical protein